MRLCENFNQDWYFTKGSEIPNGIVGESVTLPHTWNNIDGQDGGNDYYRGKCWYTKEFELPRQDKDREVWLEFGGANMVAEVYLNGTLVERHEGGYSIFRANLTDYLGQSNLLAVSVDNSSSRTVYPQKADFTFYGGIYRDVTLITVPKSHFELGYYGGLGLKVSPKISGDQAEVLLEVWTENTPDGTPVALYVEGIGKVETQVNDGYAVATLTISNVRLWDGVEDPYLYTARAELPESGDLIQTRFGCRTFDFDPDKGFILNGRSYPLCGVSRHQDWKDVGYAITPEMHRRDMELILEMGANTVRLAHYQHDQFFYDLCDEAGLVVWAEIPLISEFMPEACENSVSQMTELVVQNHNHPSIICWGLSNEITAVSDVTEELIDHHKQLNDLCHKLDSTRPTTMAHVFMLPIDSKLVTLPDIRSYNLYYGWYLGELEDNDRWFDEFRAAYPDTVIGLSEYGADANPQFQTSNPERGDYSESYQAIYHEHMLSMRTKRPYIWAMHVWNMFDFAADGRDEGGKNGLNQKGLVTFDRKLKKDAFYIYKAYLSKNPFVHLCGRRYIDRAEEVTEVKVYSNLDTVTLYIDGKEFATAKGDKVFTFEVPISGEHTISAKSGDCSDSISIHKVKEPNLDYILRGGEVLNWFEKDAVVVREGYYSIKDTMADIKKSPQGAAMMEGMMRQLADRRGDVAKGVSLPESMQQLIDRMTLEKMLKMAGEGITADMVRELNRALNQIPKYHKL